MYRQWGPQPALKYAVLLSQYGSALEIEPTLRFSVATGVRCDGLREEPEATGHGSWAEPLGGVDASGAPHRAAPTPSGGGGAVVLRRSQPLPHIRRRAGRRGCVGKWLSGQRYSCAKCGSIRKATHTPICSYHVTYSLSLSQGVPTPSLPTYSLCESAWELKSTTTAWNLSKEKDDHRTTDISRSGPAVCGMCRPRMILRPAAIHVRGVAGWAQGALGP